MPIEQNKKEQIEQIQKAYQEFENSMTTIRHNLRALVEVTLKRIDEAKAKEIVKSL